MLGGPQGSAVWCWLRGGSADSLCLLCSVTALELSGCSQQGLGVLQGLQAMLCACTSRRSLLTLSGCLSPPSLGKKKMVLANANMVWCKREILTAAAGNLPGSAVSLQQGSLQAAQALHHGPALPPAPLGDLASPLGTVLVPPVLPTCCGQLGVALVVPDAPRSSWSSRGLRGGR